MVAYTIGSDPKNDWKGITFFCGQHLLNAMVVKANHEKTLLENRIGRYYWKKPWCLNVKCKSYSNINACWQWLYVVCQKICRQTQRCYGMDKSVFQNGTKLYSAVLDGTILSQPLCFGTNEIQACRASFLRASQPTNGGRGIDMNIIEE